MTKPTRKSRRSSGGRAGRHEARASALPEDIKPVKPGFQGGRYKPLSEAEEQKIHRAALDVLANIGMGEVPQVVIDKATELGCTYDDRGRLLYSHAFVEDILAGAARDIVLHGRDPKHDIEITGRRVYFGTGGAAVRTLEFDNNTYRPSTLEDLYKFARLADNLENISWFTRNVVATDVPDILDLDINTAYVIASGTTKPLGTSFFTGEYVYPAVEMFDMMLGGEGRFRKKPFCKAHISPIVSPLRYGDDAVSVALAAIELGMPINEIIAAQSGATGPAPPAAMLVQSLAETLAGLIMVNMFAPGHPTIFSNWPFVIDLRTGAFAGSGGEISVLNAAAAQMSGFYGLPGGVSASMADAKRPDSQAGYEKAISTLAAGLAGGNLVYESAGMFASLLGASFEGMVIDNEMLGMVHRVIRGIEVSDDTIGLDVIEDVVFGPGHFLGHDQTIAAMQRDYLYPDLAGRENTDAWEEIGGEVMADRAHRRVGEILSTPAPGYVDAATDSAIREKFNILLPRSKM
ncbi:MAG: trimethylamine methyltransferase family protein [Pseudomonadota bacterium]